MDKKSLTKEFDALIGEFSYGEYQDHFAKIKSFRDKIQEIEDEHHYLRWFRVNCDFGPASEDVNASLNAQYMKETKKPLPKGWDYQDEEEDEFSDDEDV